MIACGYGITKTKLAPLSPASPNLSSSPRALAKCRAKAAPWLFVRRYVGAFMKSSKQAFLLSAIDTPAFVTDLENNTAKSLSHTQSLFAGLSFGKTLLKGIVDKVKNDLLHLSHIGFHLPQIVRHLNGKHGILLSNPALQHLSHSFYQAGDSQ